MSTRMFELEVGSWEGNRVQPPPPLERLRGTRERCKCKFLQRVQGGASAANAFSQAGLLRRWYVRHGSISAGKKYSISTLCIPHQKHDIQNKLGSPTSTVLQKLGNTSRVSFKKCGTWFVPPPRIYATVLQVSRTLSCSGNAADAVMAHHPSSRPVIASTVSVRIINISRAVAITRLCRLLEIN